MFLIPSLHPHKVIHSCVPGGRLLQPRPHQRWAVGPNLTTCFVGCNPPCAALCNIWLSLSTAFCTGRSATRQAVSHNTFVQQVIPSSLPGLPELTSADHISTSATFKFWSHLHLLNFHHSDIHRPHICYCQDCQEHKIISVKRFRRANPPAVCRSKILGRCFILHRPNAIERAVHKQTNLHEHVEKWVLAFLIQ